MINHVEIGVARYKIDFNFKRKLKIELKKSIEKIKSYLERKNVNYNIS